MDGGDFGPGVNAPPESLARVQSQTFDQIVRTLGLGDEKDDLQLDGSVPVAVAGDSTAAVPAVAAQAITVHVHTEMVAPRALPPERKRRGRPPKGQAAAPKPPPPPVTTNEEEDVCFICFDGGSLVLCDRKGCPKAYHPACIKRDEAFFRSKAKWNCGWHICSVCEKAAHHMCYTCTYSLCKGCTKAADYVHVRGNKGFCATCMKTIMLIENKDTGNQEMVQVDFDDITSWEYLFKVYWTCLKDSLSLTIDEVMQAKSLWRGVIKTDHQQTAAPQNDNFANGNLAPAFVKPPENPELNRPKDQHESPCHDTLSMEKGSSDNGTKLAEPKGWATKELLELVAHMKNGDNSLLSPFEVQSLLLEYIKTNNLRDPRRKSQIICDSRLQNLFGKPRVGHIEMLKLLESHFLAKEDDQNGGSIPAASVEHVPSHVVADQHVNGVKDINKKRRARKKSEEKAPQTNLEEFAAIDVHNISLMYLRRKVMENLLGDEQNFRDKVIGAIVRIRISSNDQGIDIFRLVQVAGITKAAQPYKVGDKTTDLMLEVLNLNKKETVSIEEISDQEFSPEECKRLRQGIRFGLLKGFSVGEIRTKAIALRATRLNDVLEAERLRLNYLRDRANEKGRKKDLRECVEKLQQLQTPEERQRRLQEIPEVHADPKMNPSFESEEDVKQDESSRPKRSKYNNNGGQPEPVPPKAKEEQRKGACWSDEKRDGKQQINIIFSNPESHVTTATTSSKGPATVCTSEMDKVWHYRDPNGKIQGPFDMVQLRKWSTTGYFPTDLRIWSGDEMNGSLLLYEAVKEQFPKAAPFCPEAAQSLEKDSCSLNIGPVSDNGLSNAVDIDQASAHQVNGLKSEEIKSVLDQVASTEIVQPSNGQMNASQSSGQNSRPFLLNLDLNQKDSNFSSASVNTPPNDLASEQPVDAVMPDLPSASPNQINGNMEIHVQDAVRSDLPAPTPQPMDVDLSVPASKEKDEALLNAAPKQMDFVLPGPSPRRTDEYQGAQLAESSQSGLPKLSVPSAGPSWSISLGFGGSQLQEVGNEWSGFSPTIPKPSGVEGWLGLVSMDSTKASDMLGGDQVTAPLMHSSGTHPGSNLNWQPIEFSTLAEESVSDLLAEVDAMESQSGLASPTSKGNDDMLDSCRNDCFSSIEELSPTQDAGKSDAVSSGEVVQFPSRSPPADDPGVDSRAAGAHSHSHTATNSEEGEIRPEPGTGTGTDTRAQPEVLPVARNRPGLEPLDTVGWSNMQGNMNMNMNMGWVGSPQGYQNWVGGAGIGAPWAANPSFNLGGAYGGAMGWADSPRRYGGGAGPPWGGYQAAEVGYGGGRGRSGWRGQPGGGSSSGGGGGGGYSRPPPKGQRVCKFYENGHCRKGSACDYLHP